MSGEWKEFLVASLVWLATIAIIATGVIIGNEIYNVVREAKVEKSSYTHPACDENSTAVILEVKKGVFVEYPC